MKYCEEYAALLDLFADGELPPEEMERVRAHLESCPGCRAYVDDALAIRAGFPDVEDTVVPEGFTQGVMDRVRASASRSGKITALKRRSAQRWLGMAAALAACCALVILVRTGPGGDTAVTTGENGAAYDTTAAVKSEETEIAPQAASEPKEEPVEGTEESQATPASRTKMAELTNKEPSSRAESADAAAPETAMDDTQLRACPAAPESQPALYLSEEEAGDLLEDLTPVWESEAERHYELNAQEYQALLTALGEELPESTEGVFRVVVTGAF